MQTNNINEAIAARDAGMQMAEDHAEAVHEDWTDKAYQFLLLYAFDKSKAFMVEEVRQAAINCGVPVPPHLRAWGSVVARAAKAGKIKKIGIQSVSNPIAHRANAAVWIAVKQAA